MGGKYKAYPEYKNSGVEGVGVIPAHWQTCALKFAVSTPITDGPHETPEFLDEGVPFVSAEAVSSGQIDFNKIRGHISKEADRVYSAKYKPRKHDIYMVKSGATTGVTAIVETDRDFNIWSPLAAIRCKPEFDPYYVLKYLRSSYFQEAVQLNWSFGTQQNIGMGVLGNLPLCSPPDDEQRKIGSFVRHETAKIDTLIEEQQSLIRLLKEKRQAVISHAVTKGLNPDVPMKDSGVEWLGEVPEHWTVTRAKFLFDFVTSGSRGWAEYYSEEGSLFFRIANLTRDTIEPKLVSIQNVNPPAGSEGERSQIKNDDLLISITADLGSVCVANSSVSDGYVSQHVALCRPGQKVANSRWLAYFVLSDCAKEQLLGSGYGGTKIQLSLEDIRELWIVQPPKEEQIDVAQFVDKQMDRYSELSREAENQIQFLQERRTALISAAVTGKIDVRDWSSN